MKLLIVGADTPTGKALLSLLRLNKISCHVLDERRFDCEDYARSEKLIARARPDQVVNLASYKANSQVAVIQAERKAEDCLRVNFKQTAMLAKICAAADIPLIQMSTPYVFDGEKKLGYNEQDIPNPQGVFGKTAWQAEQEVGKLTRHVILRSGWLFAPLQCDQIKLWIKHIKKNAGVLAASRRRFSPTPAEDMARVILAVSQQVDCQANVWGTYHYCGLETKKENDFILQILKYASQHDESIYQLLDNVKVTEVQPVLPEVANTTLATKKIFDTFGIKQRSWHGNLQATIKSLYVSQRVRNSASTAQISSVQKVMDLH